MSGEEFDPYAAPSGGLNELEAEPILVPVSPARRTPWRTAFWLLAASILGSILLVPYSISLLKQSKAPVIPEALMPVVMTVEVVFEAGMSALAIAIGLGLGARAGLGTPMLVGVGGDPADRPKAKRAVVLASVLGVLLAALIIGAGNLFEAWMPKAPGLKSPPPWEGLIASFGAGIREEVWLRYGFMTLLAWLGVVVMRKPTAGAVTVWVANVLAALAFGAIHLPQAASIIGLNAPLVVFVLLGNGMPGVVWGWLYWRKGLVTAMVSHTVADIVLKAIYPLFGS